MEFTIKLGEPGGELAHHIPGATDAVGEQATMLSESRQGVEKGFFALAGGQARRHAIAPIGVVAHDRVEQAGGIGSMKGVSVRTFHVVGEGHFRWITDNGAGISEDFAVLTKRLRLQAVSPLVHQPVAPGATDGMLEFAAASTAAGVALDPLIAVHVGAAHLDEVFGWVVRARAGHHQACVLQIAPHVFAKGQRALAE